jgi:H+/Cl- antiporter ClcA
MSSKQGRMSLQALQLGAINGLAFGILAEFVIRLIHGRERLLLRESSSDSGVTIETMPYPLSWWYLPLLSLVLVTLASVFVHRYLAHYLKSQIWRWQAIGSLPS